MIADSTLLVDVLRGDEAAIAFVKEHPQIATTDICIFEVICGALRSKHNAKANIAKAMELRTQMDVLSLDDDAVMRAAEISAHLYKIGRPIEELDCLIAGISLAHGHTKIATANKAHFERVPGISVISYPSSI